MAHLAAAIDEPRDVVGPFAGAGDVAFAVYGDGHGAAFSAGVFELEHMSIRGFDRVAVGFEFAKEFKVRGPASSVDA